MSTSAEPKEATEDLYESHDSDRPLKMARTDHSTNYWRVPGILGEMYPRFSSDEQEKIAVYVTKLLEGMPSEADLRKKTVDELKGMIHVRVRHLKNCKIAGQKEDLLQRLLALLKCRGEAVHKTWQVGGRLGGFIAWYSDNVPPGICRVEYWLARLPFEGLQQA